MPAVICTGCAVKLKLPDTLTATSVRCPKCKHVIQLETPAGGPPAKALASDAPRPNPSDQLEEAPKRKARRSAPDEDDARDEAPKKAPTKQEKPKPGELLTGAAAFAGHDIPEDIRDEICELLKKNERVLWVGRPVPEAITSRYKFLITISPYLIFGGLGVLALGMLLFLLQFVLWITGILTFPIVAILGALPFTMGGMAAGIGVGLKLLAGHGVKKANENPERRSVFVVTERQAIIHRGDWYLDGDQVQQYTPEQLANMRRKDLSSPPGCGDIIFKTVTYRTTQGRVGRVDVFGFLGIAKVRMVEEIMREVLLDRVPPEEAASLKPGAFDDEEDEDKPRVRRRAEKEEAKEDEDDRPALRSRADKPDAASAVNARRRARSKHEDED